MLIQEDGFVSYVSKEALVELSIDHSKLAETLSQLDKLDHIGQYIDTHLVEWLGATWHQRINPATIHVSDVLDMNLKDSLLEGESYLVLGLRDHIEELISATEELSILPYTKEFQGFLDESDEYV